MINILILISPMIWRLGTWINENKASATKTLVNWRGSLKQNQQDRNFAAEEQCGVEKSCSVLTNKSLVSNCDNLAISGRNNRCTCPKVDNYTPNPFEVLSHGCWLKAHQSEQGLCRDRDGDSIFRTESTNSRGTKSYRLYWS